MSLSKDAIELIQTTTLTAHGHVIPEELRDRVAVLPDGSLADIEKYQLLRQRYRGLFQTHSLADFVAYVLRAKGEQDAPDSAEGFVEIQRALSATVFFNLGSLAAPGHGDWRAVLALQQQPAYVALLAINGQRRSQKQIVEFLEDWAANVAGYNDTIGEGGEVTGSSHVSFARLLSAVRNIKIDRSSSAVSDERQYAATQSVLESVEASSSAGLPDYLVFTVEPYLGLSARRFVLRLSILSADPGEKPGLLLRIVGLQAEQEAIAQEFKGVLTEQLGTAVPLVLGEFKP